MILNNCSITGDSLKFSMEIKQNGTIEKEQVSNRN